ncbi:hypothetical protein OU995_21675 [Roseateles sp. SL47]|uniref:hypothetical protein n=1 Tax=Roseateles sp. SL47 TaxID=2995138 RepID=UPI00227210F2|nr:hypothetical protein [Roseateles sp. SL47]WAC72146.1 hypothetical protein OU995_21675 [Roseateles sp. SL47]
MSPHVSPQVSPPWPSWATRLHARWLRTCEQVEAALEDLRRAVQAGCCAQPDRDLILLALDQACDDFRLSLSHWHQRWITALPLSSVQSAGQEARQALARDTRQWLVEEELIDLIDSNGFLELRLKDTLLDALKDMEPILHTLPGSEPLKA